MINRRFEPKVADGAIISGILLMDRVPEVAMNVLEDTTIIVDANKEHIMIIALQEDACFSSA